MTARALSLPQEEGTFSPAEADAFMQAQYATNNFADSEKYASGALTATDSLVSEWSDRMRPLFRRWRATHKMLSGNTLDKGGPEDVHVPEIHKAMETIVPRIEEHVLGAQDPWFRCVPRRRRDIHLAAANGALLDWQFTQAKVRSLVQPAIRDMLVSQVAPFYGFWDNKRGWKNHRNIDVTYDERGHAKRTLRLERKEEVIFSGPRAVLVDPFDFVIDTRATDPQNAVYVGHRWWMTVDEIRRVGKQMGWENLGDVGADKAATSTTLGPFQSQYGYTSDPTARFGHLAEGQAPRDGRPDKLEVVVLYTMLSFDEGKTYRDYRIVVAAGKTVLEVRENPLDGWFRPYATARTNRNGHHFFSTGIFDNAIRLNQHADRYHQIFLRGAHIAGNPLVFTENEDSDMPDSLYEVRPFQVFKGVGAVRFTQVPDGFLRAAPLVLSMMQRNIEETIGSFRINMGQDSGGTATGDTIALQESNRRMSGIVRSFGEGMANLLDMFHRFNLQFSSEDVEFPVLGKRALDLRSSHMSVSPADLLSDVHFEIVGLRNTRNYGLKSTGWTAAMNALTPFMMANPNAIDQVGIIHDVVTELVGPDEADLRIKIPTPIDQLHSQLEENRGLLAGEEMEVDPDDNDDEHMDQLEPLYMRSLDPRDKMPLHVRRVIWTHYLRHDEQRRNKRAQEGVRQARASLQRELVAPEAGGQPAAEAGGASPQAGGFSDALMQLANEPGGQTPMENPGPASTRKYSRSGGKRRTTNQTENMAG